MKLSLKQSGLVFLSLFFLLAGNCSTGPTEQAPGGAPTRQVIDSRGEAVEIPRTPRRIATISDALVEEIMLVMGVEDRLVGIGSTCLIREFHYDYLTVDGESFSYENGMNPARFLYPEMADLPLFVRPGTEINYETLASLEPDLLIIDVGACTLPWRNDREAMEQGLARLSALGIPTLVLMGPNARSSPSIQALSEVIRILGETFERRKEASRLARFLEDSVRRVEDRTEEIPLPQRREVLLLGLNPNLRGHNTVGWTYGSRDIQSFFVEEIVHARNAYKGSRSATLSLEQILTLDPDVIILPTSNGYHPPRELYESPDFQHLQRLKAVRERRVGSLPWSPCNCDKRLEYPLDAWIMGTVTYPDRFADIDLGSWILDFYQEVYSVDRETAVALLKAQWLEWTLESGGAAP